MKRVILMSLFAFLSVFSSFAVSYSFYYDGYWGRWESDDIDALAYYGNYSGFICYQVYSYSPDHPSEWMWRFQINNYTPPTKKEKKEHLKKDLWYVYSGTFEYYITDEYQNIKSIFKSSSMPMYHFVRPSQHNVDKGQMPCVKRTVQATIKVAPYKDHPKVYNIWFEDVAMAIDLGNMYFKQ